jgi:hypothetical protein
MEGFWCWSGRPPPSRETSSDLDARGGEGSSHCSLGSANSLLLFFLGVLREMPQGSCGKLLRRFASISVRFFAILSTVGTV